MRGTIWTSGRNYVTSLPTSWGEKIKEEYEYRIEKLQINSKILITPPFDPFKKKKIELQIDPANKVELKMKLVSAYFQGYDSIELVSSSVIPKETIEYINERTVPGIYGELSTDGLRYKIDVTTPFEIQIPKILDSTKLIFQGLYQGVTTCFKTFPKLDETSKKYVSELERKLDNTLYHVIRYLNKALCYVDIFEKIGLKDDRSIIHLNSAFVYLERLGDLHRDIVKRLDKISKSNSILEIRPFHTYYKHAHETIQVAIDSLFDPPKGMELIKGKSTDWSSYRKGALVKAEKRIKDTIYSQKDPKLIRELTILEGKLYAIPDTSVNICEQAWNKEKI